MQPYVALSKAAILKGHSAVICTGKSLKDFIYECNKGKNIFFTSDVEQAIKRLSIEWLKGRDLIDAH